LLFAGTTIAGAYWYGAMGVTIGYMLGVILFVVPAVSIIFLRCRKRWHAIAA
jgi:hypothetical protein